MHPVTLRRLLVLSVCGAGVSCLYLVPGMARAPHQVGTARPHDPPTARPSRSSVLDASATASPRASATASARPSDTAPISTRETGSPERTPPADPAARSRPERSAGRGATAFDPATPADAVAPARVTDVVSAAVTPHRLTLRWPAARDNVAVTGYRVLLDGYEVAETSGTRATVRWFNDDARDHVVEVRALDAAGNESAGSPALLVARPTPAPTPSPTPTPEPEQMPEPVPTPTPSPTPLPSASSDPLEPASGPSPSSTPDASTSTGTR